MDKAPYMPDKPGVYLFRDREGRVIYAGKAVSLKNRIRSYFQPEASLPLKTRIMRKKAYSLEYILTDNEVEALILEANLIKEHQPQYNIVLKDDKSYPYLKITWQEKFPRLLVTRRVLQDGAKYYGPYSKTGAMQEILTLLKRAFPLRICSSRELPLRSRPCLNYHIHRCLAPCCDLVTESDYRQIVQQVCCFLDGKKTDLQEQLQKKMQMAAEALNFEEAAVYRDQLRALQTILARQKINVADVIDRDVLALACQADTACLMLFFIRRGKLLGRERFILDKVGEESEEAVLAAFLKQYYHQTEFIPAEILLPLNLSERNLIETWLSQKKGSRVILYQPQRGDKKKLLDMTLKNAHLVLSEVLAERLVKTTASEDLALLAAALGLAKVPERMECFDISNTQGTESVASLAVFIKGKPALPEYRKFKIRTVQGANDFASMQEAVRRRFLHGLEERRLINCGQLSSKKAEFAQFPDLLLIDGGQGQVQAACRAVEDLDLPDLQIWGLAKKEELLFAPGQSQPIKLGLEHPGLQMLQRLRDEAHRTAVTFHRQLRTKRNLKSCLSEIEGIGTVRQRELLKAFPSLKVMAEASLEELAAVPGMNKKAAQAVFNFLRENL